jgi:hypothetical protein
MGLISDSRQLFLLKTVADFEYVFLVVLGFGSRRKFLSGFYISLRQITQKGYWAVDGRHGEHPALLCLLHQPIRA